MEITQSYTENLFLPADTQLFIVLAFFKKCPTHRHLKSYLYSNKLIDPALKINTKGKLGVAGSYLPAITGRFFNKY